MNKQSSRLRRAKSTRSKIKELKIPRLSIYRTPRHIYAQLITSEGKVLAAASSLDAEIKSSTANGGNKAAASLVGSLIASRIHNLGIIKVAFDRSGFRYHGRVKELAEAARAGGLEF